MDSQRPSAALCPFDIHGGLQTCFEVTHHGAMTLRKDATFLRCRNNGFLSRILHQLLCLMYRQLPLDDAMKDVEVLFLILHINKCARVRHTYFTLCQRRLCLIG